MSREQGYQLVLGNGGAHGIGRSLIVSTCLYTLVLQFVIGSLSGCQVLILSKGNIIRNVIEVSAVVGDVQTTIAIDKGQVTIAVKTTRMTRTHRDEVAVIDIVDRCRGITIQRGGIGIHLVTTRRHVTTGKDGIMNDDTIHIQAFPSCRGGVLIL